jgi:hypothetical protein
MFEILCKEKAGPIWRAVRPMNLSVANILDVAQKLAKVPNFLSAQNPLHVFVDPENTIYEIDDVGIIAILPLDRATLHAHMTFWDGRLRGRENVCRYLATFITGLTKKQLITGVPEENKIVLAFVLRAGFEEVQRVNGVVILNFTNYTG